MNFEEAQNKKQDSIVEANGTIKENKIYIVPEISKEKDVFLELIIRGKIKYTDDLCKKYSSNGEYQVWFNPFS